MNKVEKSLTTIEIGKKCRRYSELQPKIILGKRYFFRSTIFFFRMISPIKSIATITDIRASDVASIFNELIPGDTNNSIGFKKLNIGFHWEHPKGF